ncbi:uncharacterized lipoprotein YehR (DUF1307 family) [Scopulibacillus daqui]|uniref:Uncharacterized lipoprotein YehR (DUF1307 family) n=1 Tax=Scopulibacillus daqui TaxID=1469162 RepID=A0ABS2Q098_9BACL|nr:FixH family protein [Scopulibacillus daqui]MBM7645736.1 uncharacterized lipoprotein YehR (DUF1307 family) [Scopulibacillus daqui]
MKKITIIFFIIAMIVSLTACGQGEGQGAKADHHAMSHNTKQTSGSAEPLRVDILTSANAFKANQKGEIKIRVTKGNKPVSHPEEVIFEIYKAHQQDASKKYKGMNKGNGLYGINMTFSKPGNYHVIAHVTANGTHTMPEKVFHVKPS